MAANDRVQAYATAFYDAAWDRWLTALAAAARRLTEDRDLLARVQNGSGDLAQRQRLLDGLLPPDADASLRNFLYTLLQRGDLSLLDAVVAALREQVAVTSAGPIDVEVVSAVELSEEQALALRSKLEGQFGANLAMRYRLDPTILGGVVVRAGDKLIDGSLATRLNEMRQALGVKTGA